MSLQLSEKVLHLGTNDDNVTKNSPEAYKGFWDLNSIICVLICNVIANSFRRTAEVVPSLKQIEGKTC